jgi:hypothetical protein
VTPRPRARPRASEPTGRARLAPALLLLAALAVKAVVLAQLHRHPLLQPEGGLDSEFYVRLARQAAGGDWALGREPYFLSPFYLYFLAVVFVVFKGSLLAAKVVQILLGTAAVGLVIAAGDRWYGRGAGLVAGGVAAATGVFTFNEVVLLQSAVDPFLTALGLYLLSRALLSGRLADFVVAGAALGLQVTNRPNTLLWAAALVVLVGIRPVSRGHLLRSAAVLGGLALALAPATLRNRAVSGEWILVSSHGGLNFFIGNHAEADGLYRPVPGITPRISGQAEDARRVAQAAAGRSLSTAEVSAYFYGRSWEWISREPGRALALFLRKLAYVFNALDLPLNLATPTSAATSPRCCVSWPSVPACWCRSASSASSPRRVGQEAGASGSGRPSSPSMRCPSRRSSSRAATGCRFSCRSAWGRGPRSPGWWSRRGRGRRRRSSPPRPAWPPSASSPSGAGGSTTVGRRSGPRRSSASSTKPLRAGPAAAARARPSHPEPVRPRGGAGLLGAGPDAGCGGGAGERQAGSVPRRRHASPGPRGERLVCPSRPAAAGATELEEAVRLEPTSPSAQLNLAVVYAQLRRLEDARARAEEALRLRPDYPQARGLLEQLSR